MRYRNLLPLLMLAAMLAACRPQSQTTAPSANDAVVQSALPTVTTSQTPSPDEAIAPAGGAAVEATETFLPIIESEPTATPAPPTPTVTPTATPEPTATPAAPVEGIELTVVISATLSQPVYMTHAFDERLFVVEQDGRIRIVENGQLQAAPFLDITDRVGSVSLEQGLLSVAFPPDYATPGAPGYGRFFVYYTDLNGDTRVSQFETSDSDPNTADPDSEQILLSQDQPYPNHNGGLLKFGPDGYLYVGLGDGGSANDPLGAGQDLNTWLGKILRLDVSAANGSYEVPVDNPFAGQTDALPEIWAYGLRNPWRFSFDRVTGDLYIGDVGQNRWEEISFQPGDGDGGENYGWNIMEGDHCFLAETCDMDGLVRPIFEYDHTQGCSITGGYVYRGRAQPALMGNYFLGDYCLGTIWRLFPDGRGEWNAKLVLDSTLVISSFGEDVNGELYVLDYAKGSLYRLEAP